MITLNYGFKVLDVTTDSKGAKMTFECPIDKVKYLSVFGATKQQVFDATRWANKHGLPVVAVRTSSLRVRPMGKGHSLKLPEVLAWVKAGEKNPDPVVMISEAIGIDFSETVLAPLYTPEEIAATIDPIENREEIAEVYMETKTALDHVRTAKGSIWETVLCRWVSLPIEATQAREALKAEGYRWSPKRKQWWIKNVMEVTK